MSSVLPRRLLAPASLLCALLGGVLAGSAPPATASAPASAQEAIVDPRARLSALLRQGAAPGSSTPEEWAEVETLLEPLLGVPEPPRTWRLAYDDLPSVDVVAIDLLAGDDLETTPRLAWLLLAYAPRLPLDPDGYGGEPLAGGYATGGRPGHHLFVRVGEVELLAVAESEELREPGALRALVERFDLAALAGL